MKIGGGSGIRTHGEFKYVVCLRRHQSDKDLQRTLLT